MIKFSEIKKLKCPKCKSKDISVANYSDVVEEDIKKYKRTYCYQCSRCGYEKTVKADYFMPVNDNVIMPTYIYGANYIFNNDKEELSREEVDILLEIEMDLMKFKKESEDKIDFIDDFIQAYKDKYNGKIDFERGGNDDDKIK